MSLDLFKIVSVPPSEDLLLNIGFIWSDIDYKPMMLADGY